MYTEERLTKQERKELRKEEKVLLQESQQRVKKQNSYFYIGAVIAVILLIGWWWQSNQLPIPENEKSKPSNQIFDYDWQQGNPQAGIKIVEYSDLQCPACKVYSGINEKLVNTFGDRVVIAYRHFPLREIHPNAQLAAQAAEVAGANGKFWEFTSILFAKQSEWSDVSNPTRLFQEYAKSIGLNDVDIANKLNSKQVMALVEADYLSGLLAKINSTPTFFVNGQKMNNLRGPDDLLARMELVLKEATSSSVQQ